MPMDAGLPSGGVAASDLTARALLRERSLADDRWLRDGLAAGSSGSVQDESDRAEALAMRELLLTLRFRVVSHRREIETALARLADGVHGTCLDCGRPIEAKRLRAAPWAARCHPCQTAIEQREASDLRNRR
jgi:RNA polymerase-binding transcription factor DksA